MGHGGYGIAIDLKPGMFGITALYGPLRGKSTNNSAELTAILEAIKWAKIKSYGNINIHTDSLYSIMSLSMFRRC